MECEICGEPAFEAYAILLEGTRMNVCRQCSRHGTVVSVHMPEERKAGTEVVKEEPEIEVVSDYAERVMRARKEKGITAGGLAMKISESLATIKKIEAGKLSPTEKTGAKLEKALGIKLFERLTPGRLESAKKPRPGGLTLGDVAVVKRK